MNDTNLTPQTQDTKAILWASMGLSSMVYKCTGAFRLYVLARALDPNGSGHIQADELKAAALSYGVKPRTYAAWLLQALTCGIFEGLRPETLTVCKREVTTYEILRVRSQAEAFKVFGCQSLDKQRSSISLKQLFSANWRARIFAAYIKANHDGEIISLEKLEALTGIPARTLKRDGIGNLVTAKKQYAITDKTADAVTGLNEYSSKGKYFTFIDPTTKQARAAKHVPSKRSVSNNIARIAQRGRRTAILAQLEHDGKLACNQRLLFSSQAENVTIMRLFYSTPKTQDKTPKQARNARARHEKTVIKLTQQMTRLPQDPREIFVQRGRRNVWDAIPLLDRHIFLS